MTASILLRVISLFKLLIWSWFNCGEWYLSRPFFFQVFQFGRSTGFWSISLWLYFLYVCPVSLSILSLLICISSIFVCLLVYLDKVCRSYCFSQRFHSLFFGFFVSFLLLLFVPILLILALSLIIFCHLLLWSVISFFFSSRAFRWSVEC